jgi:hypothetical protein
MIPNIQNKRYPLMTISNKKNKKEAINFNNIQTNTNIKNSQKLIINNRSMDSSFGVSGEDGSDKCQKKCHNYNLRSSTQTALTSDTEFPNLEGDLEKKSDKEYIKVLKKALQEVCDQNQIVIPSSFPPFFIKIHKFPISLPLIPFFFLFHCVLAQKKSDRTGT